MKTATKRAKHTTAPRLASERPHLEPVNRAEVYALALELAIDEDNRTTAPLTLERMNRRQALRRRLDETDVLTEIYARSQAERWAGR